MERRVSSLHRNSPCRDTQKPRWSRGSRAQGPHQKCQETAAPCLTTGPLRSPRGRASALLDVSADWTDRVPKTSSPSPTYRSSESSLPWQQIRASLAAMAGPAARIRQRLCFEVLRSSCRASRQGYQHVPYHQRKRQRHPAHRM